MNRDAPFQTALIRLRDVIAGDPALQFACVAIALIAIGWFVLVRRAAGSRREAAAASEARLAELLRAQSEMQGRIAAMAEVFGARQAETNQAINQRLDGLTQRLGQSISEQTRATHENLRRLQERLAVIDRLVLRLAVYEMLERREVPSAVVINEALELARTFSAPDAVRFVNGVLDAIRKKIESEREPGSGNREPGTSPRR